MKVDIWEIWLALYAGELKYLDLDTGKVCSKFCADRGWIATPKHNRILPQYSRAHIYQKYLREMLPKTPFEDTIHLDAYPDFPLLVSKDWQELMLEFVSKADHFLFKPWWYEYECQNEEKRKNGSSDYDPTFIPNRVYMDAFKRKVAIQWCKKQGYEWYDSHGQSGHEGPPSGDSQF